eukprot:3619880-Ditylum_brightwellii.AAC.1
MGKETKKDIKEINKRWLGNKSIKLPADGTTCFACTQNQECNAISTQVVSKLVQQTHPSISNMNSSIHLLTLVIESSIRKGKHKVSQQNLNAITKHCGDADVVTSKNKRINPASKLYNSIPLMINTNDDIKNFRADGTLCRGCAAKLKSNAKVQKKFGITD